MRSRKALYNIGTNLLLQIIAIVYGFIVPKIIINSYGSNVNGLISSITQFLAYIALLESGFGPVVKSALYKPIASKDNIAIGNILKTSERFFRKIALIFLVYIFLLCFLYPLLVSKDFGWIYTVSLIVIIGISTFAEYYFGMTYKLYLQAEQKTYVISIIQTLAYILSAILIIVLASIGASIQIIKLVSGLVFVIRPILQNYYVKKKYNINFTDIDNKYELKQKWDGLAQHIAAVIHGNTDITILTIFTSLTEVSVYSVYYLVVRGLKSLIQSFTGGIDAAFGDMIAKKEKENLNKNFSMYEVLYNTVSTIIFTCAIVLITPFIVVYTNNVTDANYIRYAFGVLIVISEYIWAIRLPYSSITLAAGHFKETRVGAWIECLANIVISILLVWKFGIIGVTIGTIVAMTIRTFEFIYHSNKYILDRSFFESVKKISLVIFETLVIVYICKWVPFVGNTNFGNWIVNAIMVWFVACMVTIIVNCIFYNKEYKNAIKMVRKIKRRKYEKNRIEQ